VYTALDFVAIGSCSSSGFNNYCNRPHLLRDFHRTHPAEFCCHSSNRVE